MKRLLVLVILLLLSTASRLLAQITEIPIPDLQARYPYILSVKAVTAEDDSGTIGYLIINLDQDKLFEKINHLVKDSAQSFLKHSFPLILDSVYGTSPNAFKLATSHTNNILSYTDSLRWSSSFSVVFTELDPTMRNCLEGSWFNSYINTTVCGHIPKSPANENSIVFTLQSFIRYFYISGLNLLNNRICYRRDAKTMKDLRPITFSNISELGIENFINHTQYIRFCQDWQAKKLWCYLVLEK